MSMKKKQKNNFVESFVKWILIGYPRSFCKNYHKNDWNWKWFLEKKLQNYIVNNNFVQKTFNKIYFSSDSW